MFFIYIFIIIITTTTAVLNYTKKSLTIALNELDNNPSYKGLSVHVRYQDTVVDAKSQCKLICEASNLSFTKDYETLIDNYLEESNIKRSKLMKSKGTAGKLHNYSLEMYGLSEEIVKNEFKDYIARFNLDEK